MSTLKLFEDKVVKELELRYMECDKYGHKSIEDGHCTYCHRRSEYTAPKVKAILEGRRKLHPFQQPCDAPVMYEKRLREIKSQKFEDKIKGLQKIAEELSKD